MNLYDINATTLSRELGEEIPDAYIVLAKHQALGLTLDQIAEILKCPIADVVEVAQSELYQRVQSFIVGVHAQQTAGQTTGWDAIEQMAIDGLVKRLPYEKDSEFLLKAAAVANRAQRKHDGSDKVLDPAARGTTQIMLTTRLVEKLANKNGGVSTVETVKQVSIRDGSMQNPSFTEVDAFLNPQLPRIPMPDELKMETHEPTVEEIFLGMSQKSK